MNFFGDQRAQSMTYILAIGTVILFTAMYAVFQEPAAMLLSAGADICVTEQCETGHGHVTTIWQWLPLTAAMLVVLMVLSAAVFKSGRGF